MKIVMQTQFAERFGPEKRFFTAQNIKKCAEDYARIWVGQWYFKR